MKRPLGTGCSWEKKKEEKCMIGWGRFFLAGFESIQQYETTNSTVNLPHDLRDIVHFLLKKIRKKKKHDISE